MPSLVMTLIGSDRPGLVESLSATVAAHEANWLESRMAHLAGQFAGILSVDVAADKVDALVAALQQMDQHGLTVIVQKDSAPAQAVNEFTPILMDLMGNDRPGIVREVSRVLAELRVNVEDIQTQCLPAAMTGEQLFQAKAKLRLPSGLTIVDVRQKLEEIAGDLMVDISIKDDGTS